MLALAAAAEAGSEHPVAMAIVAAARERGFEIAPAVDFRALPGRGVRAAVGGAQVWVGRPQQRETPSGRRTRDARSVCRSARGAR